MKDCLVLVIISMFHIHGIVDKRLKNNKISKIWAALSMLLGIALVFLLAMSRESYAVAIAFLLLISQVRCRQLYGKCHL